MTPLSYIIFANDPIGLLLDILVIVVIVGLIVYVVRRLLIVLLVITLLGAFTAKASDETTRVDNSTTPTVTVPGNRAVLIKSDPAVTRPTTRPGDDSGTTIVVKPPNQPVILIPSGSPDGTPLAIPVPDSPVWRWLAPVLTLILSMGAAALSIWAKTHATDANERSKNTNDRLAMMDPNAPVFRGTSKTGPRDV